ncbi:unnamed protein product [Thelazia callipaeda]|uniref:ATP synthase-coupling factor 6, mitochondrial n=1 Tax=Thelazia callipaeda TaxID=103827 RepID=A0A0N5CS23_THECL|nr:unnamed protein product [Thelazia callipaeda]
MLLKVGFSSGYRMASTGMQRIKSDTLVKDLFLRKIKEFEAKIAGKEDILVDATPETLRSLDDQLLRLANKYHLENKEMVKELPTKCFEMPSLQSAVSVLFEGKSLDDLNKELAEEIKEYTSSRQKKLAEQEEAQVHMQKSLDQVPTKDPKSR